MDDLALLMRIRQQTMGMAVPAGEAVVVMVVVFMKTVMMVLVVLTVRAQGHCGARLQIGQRGLRLVIASAGSTHQATSTV
jgi:hypothetical protein